MADSSQRLCLIDGCRKLHGHRGKHSKTPNDAWNFFLDKDKDKINKAGFATPRGGEKNGYQNHVTRNNKIIIPYERLSDVNLEQFQDGYVIRLLPEQYFESSLKPYQKFSELDNKIQVGINAFVLYRSRSSLESFPPLNGWEIRSLLKNGQPVMRRGRDVIDVGHYIIRIPALGNNPEIKKGSPQGIFAIEYADQETNYLCKCVLAWLIIHTHGSPYTLSQASHLSLILKNDKLDNYHYLENSGIIRHGLCTCPLCLQVIKYQELHEMVNFDDENGLENASMQVEGATRSTIVNLFHLYPLNYRSLEHVAKKVGWGHAVCNTRLGQRRCFSLNELIDTNLKVGVIFSDKIETFGWISENYEMIRSPNGAVWIRISEDNFQELDDEIMPDFSHD